MKIKTGDAYLMKRIKELISQGKIEVSGNLSGSWKDFDVRQAGIKKEQEQSTIEEQANG